MSVKKAAGYTMDMTSGPLLKKVLLFSLPLMLSCALQLLFSAVDLAVVGRFAGDNAMAAVGANSSLINLMVTLFTGLAVGANVQAAREQGANQPEELVRTVHTSMALSVISGLLLMVVAEVSAPVVLGWMQVPENIYQQAVLYLRIYFVGMPASMVYNFGAALLRSVGDTRRPLLYLTAAGITNLVLDLLLVIVFHMDVAGVGIATVVSQVISAALVLRCMLRSEGEMHLDLRQLRLHRDKVRSILRVGIPAGLQNALFSVSNVVIQSSVNTFGEVAVAGNAAANNLEGFIWCVTNGFQQAALSFTSQNLGAGKYERLPRILVVTNACMAVASVGIWLLCANWGEGLLSIYSNTDAVIQMGMLRLSVMSGFCLLWGQVDITADAIRGMGFAMMPTMVTMLGVCGFRLVWIATVFQMPQYHSLQTLYACYPISWVITGSVHLICFCLAFRKIRHMYGKTSD